MAGFKDALKFVLAIEKAYANVDGDSGGETIWGVAKNKNPQWPGWARVDALKKSPTWKMFLETDQALMAHVEAFYFSEFWGRMRCDDMPYAVSLPLFDMAVNCGCSAAVKALQRAIFDAGRFSCAVDGVIGREALEGVRRCDPARLSDEFLFQRLDYYADLAFKKPSQRQFLLGWLKRTLVVEKLADAA